MSVLDLATSSADEDVAGEAVSDGFLARIKRVPLGATGTRRGYSDAHSHAWDHSHAHADIDSLGRGPSRSTCRRRR